MDCVLLAAGNSTRFGENKLLYKLKEKPMYQYILDTLLLEKSRGKIEQIIFVTQYDEIADEIKERVGELVWIVRNDQPEMGISHSIYMGLEKVMERVPDSNACLFAVCDQPFLKPETVEGLIELWEKSTENIAALECQGVIGNPVIFSRKYYDQLGCLSGDVGGKKVLQSNMCDVVLYPANRTELEDIDVKNIPVEKSKN